jgi:nucleoid-associated protein YgaU
MKWVTFACPQLGTSCRPKLTGAVTLVQHQGEGWQNVQKQWGISYTVYQGGPAYELQIPCIFDQLATNPALGTAMNNIEAECLKMERMSEIQPGTTQPPIISIDGGGAIPRDKVNDPAKQWVISVCSWGDYVLARNQIYRCRQEFTVTAWDYRPETILKGAQRLPDRPVPKTYKIVKGDTIPKIAAYFYGDQSKWHDIATLNKIVHPLNPQVGRVIKMPAA